ncbi:response regulator [Paenibacillus xerothermodurans]|uniref:Response regulator n=1 Tax=Paenibacillus xerothermodurans TaxID=1977292 RepID=A0A2W1NZV4_PAEXE|nr:response regulator [Paenibacillus xerothermodurans]PZE20408.1 response regulator [Paenibacillus xerothermodurans]
MICCNPDLAAAGLFSYLIGKNGDAPVILLTAKALEKDRVRAEAAGVTTYVVKPFSPLKLVDTVKELMGSSV